MYKNHEKISNTTVIPPCFNVLAFKITASENEVNTMSRFYFYMSLEDGPKPPHCSK